MTGTNIWPGVACGVAAGACWGLVFLAPELAARFSPLQLASGRYLAYGLLAAALIAPRLRATVRRLGPREWRALAELSLSGNLLYYVLLATAVQRGGIAMTSLVIGFLPVAVTLIGSRGQGSVPLRRLAPSLALGCAGIACVAWEAIAADTGRPLADSLAGLACAVGALACWTTYAVHNSRWLARLQQVSAHDWNLLTGLVTGVLAMALAWPAFAWSMASHTPAQWLHFAAVVSGVALVASILGGALWNRASRLLPLTLIGQMILFETLFALLYGFLWEARLPTVLEAAALVLVIGSVSSCVAAHRPRGTLAAAPASARRGRHELEPVDRRAG